MGSHQLITVPDHNWITITSNNPLGFFWSNYSVCLNKMADTWWFEETKLLITLWSEEAVQHELNTMHNKKLVWDKISQGMADGGYSSSAQQYHVKINTSSKNIARFGTATKFLEINDKNRCLNQWTVFLAVYFNIRGCEQNHNWIKSLEYDRLNRNSVEYN